jgi:tetratricopeptide (TPR) repeat protein
VLCALAGAGVFLSACLASEPAPQARAALRRGLELLAQSKYEEALSALDEAERGLPKEAAVHNFAGIALTKLGRIAEANDHYRKALALDPRLADVHKNLGFNYWTAGKAGEAERCFRAALQLNPGDEFSHYGIGALYLAQNRGPEAIPHLEKAKSLVEHDQPVLLRFASALIGARRPGEAVALLEAEAARRPEDANVAGVLAAAYESSGDLPRALANYERAVKLDPSNQDRYLDYTRLLLDLDRYEESIQVVQRGLGKVQDSYTLQLRLGATEMMRGNAQAAEGSFRKAIDMHPEIPLGYVALAKAFLKSGRGSDALALLAEARAKLPPDFLLEYFSGVAAENLARESEAADAYARAAALDPGVPDAHFKLGKLLLKSGQTGKAKAELEQAIALDPRHAGAHFQLSRVYAQLGDPESARSFAAKAAQLRKDETAEAQRGVAGRIQSGETLPGASRVSP